MEREQGIHIEANNSTVVVGSTGTVTIGASPLSEMEEELLRVYRGLSTRQKIELLSQAYEIEEENKKSPPSDTSEKGPRKQKNNQGKPPVINKNALPVLRPPTGLEVHPPQA